MPVPPHHSNPFAGRGGTGVAAAGLSRALLRPAIVLTAGVNAKRYDPLPVRDAVGHLGARPAGPSGKALSCNATETLAAHRQIRRMAQGSGRTYPAREVCDAP